MGKVKVATLGSEEEQALKEKQRVSREQKKKREKAANVEKVHISGMKGGERIKSVGASEEELEKMAKLTEEVEKDQAVGIKTEAKKSRRAAKKRVRGSRYKSAQTKIEHGKPYAIEEAVKLLREVSLTSFDPSVELHINTIEKGLRGSVSLPHGTGKKIRVAIADSDTIDKIISEVESGKIGFDALVAHPSVMPKLARVAKFLGPNGLMPNPKNGTISPTPEKVAKKLEAGEINWKTESDFPIIHLVIGKLSFKDNQLTENFAVLVKSISPVKIKNITLKSSMSPGIKVAVS